MTSNQDMAEKRTNSTHVRLTDEAYAVLELLAEARNDDKAAVLSVLCEEALLGRGHALKVAALRFARLGFGGRAGE